MLTMESLCVYSLQWCLSSLSGSNVLSLEGTGERQITLTGPCSQPLWPPLGSPWQPFGTPGTRLAAQASSHRLRKQPRGPPDPHFGALAYMPCMFSLFAPARFPTILDQFWNPKANLLGPTTIPWDSFWDPQPSPGTLLWDPFPPFGPFSILLGSL